MPLNDEWAQDPSVQTMRRIFAGMEEAQKQLLNDLGLGGFDPRLREVRTQARVLFDRLWPEAVRSRLVAGEERPVLFYMHCFCRMLTQRGIEVPSHVFRSNEKVVQFLNRVAG